MRLKKGINFLFFLAISAFVFVLSSCKNEIKSADAVFLSGASAAVLQNGIARSGNASEIDLADYDVKSALGPLEATEYELDDDFFINDSEKFASGFSNTLPEGVHGIDGDEVSIDVSDESDLYYVFTNTSGKNLNTPSFSIPNLKPENADDSVQLPSLPFILDSASYVPGPGNINFSKSILSSNLGMGNLALYYYSDFPKDFLIIGSKVVKIPVADEAESKYEEVCKFRREVSNSSRDLAIGLTVLVGTIAAACGIIGVVADGVTVPLLCNYTDLYDSESIVGYVMNYTQWTKMLLNSYLPDCHVVNAYGIPGTISSNSGFGGMRKDYEYNMLLGYIEPWKDKLLEANLVNNRIAGGTNGLVWLVEGADYSKPTRDANLRLDENSYPVADYIYNYADFNYYDYYNPSDRRAVYITDGALGFGAYVPLFKWFYPIEPQDGEAGYGYYVGGKIMKYAPEAFRVEESQDDGSAVTSNDFNSAVIPTSLDSRSIISQTLFRINNSELPPPLRLVKKQNTELLVKDETDPATETETELTSPLGDKVGGKQTFIELLSSRYGSYYRNATCRLVRKVDTAFGERFLVIYEQDSLSSHPSDEEYEKIADAFLKPGDNNDIYDKITNVFGSEWGYLNSTYLKTLSSDTDELDANKVIPFIPKTNTITLFYTDIANKGESNDYLAASYLSSDIRTNPSSLPSNERLMIHLHAPKARGKYLEENIIALACEFERLIHDQYFSPELNAYLSTPIEEDKSGLSDYFFQFLAKLIASSSLRDNSIYTLPSSYNLYPFADTSFTDLFGADKYYLFGLDKLDILSLSLFASKNIDYNAITKSVIAMLSYYLYTNFGSGFIQNYTLSSKEGLLGIIDAINQTYDTSYTLSDILLSLATATLLSSTPSQTRPYTFNYLNRFKVQGVDYPNINFANTKAYMADTTGIQSSTSSSIINNSSSFYRVASSFKGKYEAKAPTLPDGLRLTLVAVPTNND